MSTQWMALSLVGLLALAGCAETNRLEDTGEVDLPAEDVQALDQRDGAADRVVIDENTELAPQHVLKPEIDGAMIEPVEADELADDLRATPESTPEKKNTGEDAIEESLIDEENIDSEDLNNRLDQALDLDEQPAADVPSETTATLRADDEPIREEPATDTPSLDQERLGEEIAPEDPADAFRPDDAVNAAQAEQATEEKQATADVLTEAIAQADDEVGEAVETVEETLEQTLEAVNPDDASGELPPTLPLEDPAAARESADAVEIQSQKPVVDLTTGDAAVEQFSIRTFTTAAGEQLTGEAARQELTKVEREVAAMRAALSKQRMIVGEVAVHLNSLQQNMALLAEATSEDQLDRERAVKASALALEYSLREARGMFPSLTSQSPADNQADLGGADQTNPGVPRDVAAEDTPPQTP